MGCLAYASVLGPTKYQDKFASRKRKFVFIGYPQNQKGYKLYDLDTHELFVSRDVTFFEHIFPFHNSPLSSPDQPIQPFYLASDSEFHIPLDSSAHSSVSHSSEPIKRLTRISHPPAWLADFGTPTTSHVALDAFNYHISPNSLVTSSPAHTSFLANIISAMEPQSYSQAK